MPDTLYLTREGLDKLAEELSQLKLRRREVVKRIQEAKEYGDLSENSEYDDAKNEQAFVEGRISEVEEIMRKAKVVNKEHKTTHVIELGATVVVEMDSEEDIYIIVGATEADPMKGKVSVDSPTGKAFLGHKAGEKVVVQAPSGKVEYLIKSVKF